jgi:hypothetical protein
MHANSGGSRRVSRSSTSRWSPLRAYCSEEASDSAGGASLGHDAAGLELILHARSPMLLAVMTFPLFLERGPLAPATARKYDPRVDCRIDPHCTRW